MNTRASAERVGSTGGWLESMLDSALRPVTDRALSPLARSPLGRADPVVISAVAMVLSIWAAVAAWRGAPVLAVGLWLIGRIADGLDGLTARGARRPSELGGLADIVSRTVGYAAIPIGVAAGIGDTSAWVAATVLLSTMYVDAGSTGYLIARRERRGSVRDETGAPTPRGLIERTETIVLFSLALAFPGASVAIFWLMAVAVAVTVVERMRWATRALG